MAKTNLPYHRVSKLLRSGYDGLWFNKHRIPAVMRFNSFNCKMQHEKEGENKIVYTDDGSNQIIYNEKTEVLFYTRNTKNSNRQNSDEKFYIAGKANGKYRMLLPNARSLDDSLEVNLRDGMILPEDNQMLIESLGVIPKYLDWNLQGSFHDQRRVVVDAVKQLQKSYPNVKIYRSSHYILSFDWPCVIDHNVVKLMSSKTDCVMTLMDSTHQMCLAKINDQYYSIGFGDYVGPTFTKFGIRVNNMTEKLKFVEYGGCVFNAHAFLLIASSFIHRRQNREQLSTKDFEDIFKDEKSWKEYICDNYNLDRRKDVDYADDTVNLIDSRDVGKFASLFILRKDDRENNWSGRRRL